MSGEGILKSLVDKLNIVFKDDQEVLKKVLSYLTEEKNASVYRDGPVLKMLKCMLDIDAGFEECARNLAEDIKNAENDEKFKEFIGVIYSQMMDGSQVLEDIAKLHQLPLSKALEQVAIKVAPGVIHAVALIPFERQLLTKINNIFSPSLSKLLTKSVEIVNYYGATGFTVSIAALYLAPKIIDGIKKWLNNEITGNRSSKIIIDEVSTVVGSIGGGYAGVLTGAYLGPFGILAGGIIGGMLVGEAASRFGDQLTQTIFNIPKEAALENAYGYFGIDKSASNHDINVAYRKKCIQHNPDKVGDYKEFHKVQISMATIKAAKRQQ